MPREAKAPEPMLRPPSQDISRQFRRPSREPYQEYRAPLQAKWRPYILARDKGKCRACRSKEEPEMAHITDAVAFVRAAGGKAFGVTFSYRWDNLIILCGTCHAISHAWRWRDEDMPVRQKVFDLYDTLRRLRGWSSPFAVLPPELVPPAMRPARSFHDCMRISPLVPFPTFAKYAADGGLVFAERERSPGQAHLVQAAASPETGFAVL